MDRPDPNLRLALHQSQTSFHLAQKLYNDAIKTYKTTIHNTGTDNAYVKICLGRATRAYNTMRAAEMLFLNAEQTWEDSKRLLDTIPVEGEDGFARGPVRVPGMSTDEFCAAWVRHVVEKSLRGCLLGDGKSLRWGGR